MAVNDGCPDCQKTYGQPAISKASGHATTDPPRSRTASPENGTIFNPYFTGRPRTPANGTKPTTVDRQEIIKRIKSNGSRPTSPELDRSIVADRQDLIRRIKAGGSRPASPELERTSSSDYRRRRESPLARPTTPLSAVSRPKSPEIQQDNESLGLQIERPRSALHRGDFRQKEESEATLGRFDGSQAIDLNLLSTSPVAPWHPEFPSAVYRQTRDAQTPLLTQNGMPIPARSTRERAISHASLAASFVYKAPTSPLVQSSRPDTPEPSQRGRSRSPDKSRRHTFSPQSFRAFQSDLDYPTSARNSGRAGPPLRSEKTFPYQAHQPRRSLNTASFSSLPQSPSSGSRRPSISAASPLHHAPLVGSYEESILRGRMSTVPSRPLNFNAQIGVLGKGNCKSNLRCPPHVSVPFQAVFYDYSSGTNIPANNQPSPYVGELDLENHLANQEEASDKRRQRFHDPFSNEGSRASSPKGVLEDAAVSEAQIRRRKRQKAKRRSGSPKAPPGGSYRIPQQGQLQIVIKNPNKTAVKLFLVPYDLSDMEPGQKTFIRQRSYSAGPIIDMPLSSRKNLGTDRPEAAINPTGDPNDKPVLRYLIHLHICCPAKGRYFLYKSVRVVFANRVPDGKEKLRNEIQLPEPRYSTYKPGRDSNIGLANGILKDPARRRSTLESNLHGSVWPVMSHGLAQSLPRQEVSNTYSSPMPALPHHSTILPTLESRPSSQHLSDGMDTDSVSPGTPSVRSPVSSNGDNSLKAALRLDDPFTFSRDSNRDQRMGGRSESLLSRRLMDLAFQNQGIQGPGDEDA